MGLGIALKAFSAALFDREKSDKIEQLLAGKDAPAATVPVIESPKAEEKPIPKPARDSALTLLSTLQREARLIDLLREDLSKYSDAQVGAASRPCLQKCSGVLERMFAVKPLVDQAEGSTVQVPAEASPLRYQWVGEGTAAMAKLIHPGWQADKVDVPQWSGDSNDQTVIAAAQIQTI